MPSLQRHIDACNNTHTPAPRLPFRIGDRQVGWIMPELVQALTFFPRDVHFDGRGVSLAGRLRGAGAATAALERLARHLADRGFLRIRGEMFDVRETAEGPVLGTLDRGAVPAFGVIGQGVHLNGLVRREDGLHVWVGVRARDKAVAPGQFDNIVAGGMPAGLTAEECLVKEAAEEAGMPPELAALATRTGRISYILTNAEGLRRDVLHCFDIELPRDFTPRPNDDEVERFELWPAARLLECVRETERVKFNVNLVLIDLFLREGLIAADSAEGRALRAGLAAGP
jgi:8-oxo-dGTP pyrophosphatase MutT (NUDIX family)